MTAQRSKVNMPRRVGTDGTRFLSFFVLLSTVAADTFSLCYDCFGNSSDIGSFCSIDKLCEGAGCYFEARGNGRWVAGCIDSVQSGVSASFAMSRVQPSFSCSNSGDLTLCHCVGDLCNHVTHASHYLQHTYWKSLHFVNHTRPADPVLPPNLTVNCHECGMVQTSNGPWNITNCLNFCKGSYCMTRGGRYPHSFCGTTWEGKSNPHCVVHVDGSQLCSCNSDRCNYLLPPLMPDSTTTILFTTNNDPRVTTTTPQAIQESTTSTSTLSPDTTTSLLLTTLGVTSTTTTTTGTPAPTTGSTVGTTIPVNCVNGQFTPNQQAVQIGEKLKNIIENGIQPQDISDFNQAINNHICSYSSSSVGGKK